MPNASLKRCMGRIHPSAFGRKQCNMCKRLPRNRDDEDAEKWIVAKDCLFIPADPGYLERHPEGF